jgi:hypothetical protein
LFLEHGLPGNESLAGLLMGWSAALARRQWGYNGEDRRHPMELHAIGIDLGKTVFHLVGLNLRGEVVVRKSVRASNCCTLRRT